MLAWCRNIRKNDPARNDAALFKLRHYRLSASVPPYPGCRVMIQLILGGAEMYRSLGAVALLTIAIAAPVQDAAAQDPVGGAILGGAAGAILGGDP